MLRNAVLLLVISPAFLLYSFPSQAQVSFFQPPTYVGGGYGVTTLFVADFNGDGKPDILTPDGFLNLGNGDGTFKQGKLVSGTVLAVADFNGDGKPDILEQGIGILLVLLGNGDGTFQSPISTNSGAALVSVAAVDLNGDHKSDVVGVFNSSLYVYISNGDGTFKTGVPYNAGIPSTYLVVLSLGDFNNDQKIDVALSTSENNVVGQEIVLLGNGDGTFQPPAVVISSHGALVVNDLNGDGKPDLVFASAGPSLANSTSFAAIQVYLGNGDGTFTNASNYQLCLLPQSGVCGAGMAVADFNSDGKPDIAGSNAVLLGNGNGTFQGWQLGVVSAAPVAAVTGQFDKTRAPEVAAVSTTNAYILSNDGTGTLSMAHTYTLQAPGYAIATADFNGDGNLDLIVIGIDPLSQDWNYSVLLGNGDGSFQSPVFYPQSSPVRSSQLSIVVANFNNDHKPDFAVSLGTDTYSLVVLLGNGDGTFASPVPYFDAGFSPLLVADFNGDGKLDIAAGGTDYSTTPVTQKTLMLLGNGDGTFQAAVSPSSLNNFAAAFTADFNNDGKLDLFSGSQVALGNGDGTFTLLPMMSSGGLAAAIADLNGDGIADLLGYVGSVHTGIQTVIQLGNGDGTFSPFIPVLTDAVVAGALTADMNGDGKPDLIFLSTALGSAGVNGVGVILNTAPIGPELSASVLSPTPVQAGNSATSTITIRPQFGFNGSVALSCTGLPSGANCAFDPPSIPNSSGTAIVTITTTTSLAAGTYTIQILGSSGSTTNSVPVSLLVQPAPDFTIGPAAEPTSETISVGQTATFVLLLTATGSFSGTANLSCAITPAVTPAPTCKLVKLFGAGQHHH